MQTNKQVYHNCNSFSLPPSLPPSLPFPPSFPPPLIHSLAHSFIQSVSHLPQRVTSEHHIGQLQPLHQLVQTVHEVLHTGCLVIPPSSFPSTAAAAGEAAAAGGGGAGHAATSAGGAAHTAPVHRQHTAELLGEVVVIVCFM
jgi:hypothetical protein